MSRINLEIEIDAKLVILKYPALPENLMLFPEGIVAAQCVSDARFCHRSWIEKFIQNHRIDTVRQGQLA